MEKVHRVTKQNDWFENNMKRKIFLEMFHVYLAY